MLTQLRAIFDLIIQFQSTQESMYSSALDELRARQRIDEISEKRGSKVALVFHNCIFRCSCSLVKMLEIIICCVWYFNKNKKRQIVFEVPSNMIEK